MQTFRVVKVTQSRLGLGLCFWAACTSLASCQAPKFRTQFSQSQPDPAWDAFFTRTSSWNGGDIIHSVDLGDHRTLWLFGDSIFGPIEGGHRVGDRSKMLRAGVAWHSTPKNGEAPTFDSVTFAGPKPFKGANVVSWAAPTPGLFPAGSWYWLMNDGVRIKSPTDHLVLFATAIGPAGNPDGMWDFRRVGGAIIEISNPAAPPDQWKAAQAVNPLVNADPRHGEPPRAGDNHAVAILPSPDGASFYLYGVHYATDRSKSLIVGTANVANLSQPEKWTFFDGSGWRASAAAAKVIATDVPDEFTIQRVRRSGRDVLVMVQIETFGSRHLIARTALKPEGPWSTGVRIYETPDYGKSSFVYAAKGHVHLSRPGELLVSYAVNADLGRVFNEPSLYRPNFVRVPLEALPEPLNGP
ncbi:MAG: hypothetical protein AABZ53_15740 [Planctomycetota bacterium]